MQESFNFGAEKFIETAFFNFTEGEFFKEIVDFALQRGTFICISLKEKNLDIIYSHLAQKKDIFDSEGDFNRKKYCFLPSFWNGSDEKELKFLDALKTLISQGKTFIGIFNKTKTRQFCLYDLQSRVSASIMLDFESDIKFESNIKESLPLLAQSFFIKNGLKIEKEVIDLIMAHSNRNLPSFGVFLEALKDYTLQTLKKPSKKNFKFILAEYEKRKSREDF